MSINSINNNINSSILNNTFNQNTNAKNSTSDLLQSAVTQPFENQLSSKEDLLAGVAKQQIGLTSNILSGLSGGDELTNQLVSFSVNANNQLAADRLPDEYSKTVGSIIDLTI